MADPNIKVIVGDPRRETGLVNFDIPVLQADKPLEILDKLRTTTLNTDAPVLNQVITEIIEQLQAVTTTLAPIVQQLQVVSTPLTPVFPVTQFTAVSIGSAVRLSWDNIFGTGVFFLYEIRKGTNWDTASFQLKTSGLSAIIDPLPYGTHTYLLKTVSSSGEYSVETIAVALLVSQILGVTIIKTVIDNNVLLKWSAPVSVFNIKEYRLKKGGVLVGTITGTFTNFFEVVAGSYTYSITAVDVAGNVGDESFITVLVATPPDYALQDTRVSTLLGTRTNVLLEDGPRLVCSWLSETYGNHFTSRGWASPQAQVTAGYPIYIQPANTTGAYEEVFDYGAIFSNVIVTATWNINILTIASAVSIIVKMAVSSDNITYSSFVSGASQFYTSFRYLKLRLEFTGVDDKALIELYNLTINLNVKREMDGGEVAALATDVAGTEVIFSKPFKDIESITCTVKSVNEPYIVIYDFTDIPNPVHFFVYVFDTTGNRVSETVSWKARGIV